VNKVIAYTALLYGRDYLAYAIESIIDYVDEYHVLYASQGSHGHRTSTPCPETRDELYAVASTVAGRKLRWHDGEWAHEGLQRDSIYQYAPDADVIIVLDSDEIWGAGLAANAIQKCLYGDATHYRVPMIHYWRSFNRCVLHDPSYPIRVMSKKAQYVLYEELSTGHLWDNQKERNKHCYINHMGYAQRPEIVEYKILTHGHRNEWRRDVDWFKDKFMANAQTDVHPVGSEYWNPEPVKPLDYMPDWMASHPYFGMEVIE
jgi:hypothetical protein